MIPPVHSGTLSSPRFSGVYRLVSNQYGIPHDIENPGRDNVLPYRVGQYLHPGSLPEERGSQWDNYYGADNNFNILLDGPDLATYNRQSDTIARIRSLATDSIQKNTLDNVDARLFVDLSRRAVPLDVTAIQENPQAFPIDPAAGSRLSSPANNNALTPPPLLSDRPANPMAALGPQAGLDSNAVLPTMAQTQDLQAPATGLADQASAESDASSLPQPQPMAYTLQSASPLDPATVSGAVSHGG